MQMQIKYLQPANNTIAIRKFLIWTPNFETEMGTYITKTEKQNIFI